MGKRKNGRPKRRAFFGFPSNACLELYSNNLWYRQCATVSCGYRTWVAVSLSGMRVQGLVTLWDLGLFNKVVICHKEDHPSIPSSLCQVALFIKFLVSLIKKGFKSTCLRMVSPILMKYVSSVCSSLSTVSSRVATWVCMCSTLKPMLVAPLSQMHPVSYIHVS